MSCWDVLRCGIKVIIEAVINYSHSSAGRAIGLFVLKSISLAPIYKTVDVEVFILWYNK